MSRFPRPEAEIVALAGSMIAGLSSGQEIFPSPPVTTERLAALRTAYLDARSELVAAGAVIEQSLNKKDGALTELIGAMKSDLRYAENATNYSDECLKILGWGGRRVCEMRPSPGQVRLLIICEQGEGHITLQWKTPAQGGKAIAYRILRRQQTAGTWIDATMSLACKATLIDQPRGVECEYRVVAVNHAGEGEPSNTVAVVL
ncbi:MAG: fibronectin type III domain-containing protein [Phycisphaerales bacterium]|jgi:hypothetical protein